MENSISNYSEFSFLELIEKISKSRFFSLPKMIAETFRKIPISNNLRPYKVYSALLTQSGISIPVATVLEKI